jgi:hypothetical protein
MLSVAEMFVISNYQWATRRYSVTGRVLDVPKLLVSEFSRPRSLSATQIMSRDAPGYNVGLFPNWGFKRHADNYLRFLNFNGEPLPKVTASEFAAVQRFYGADRNAQRIFLSSRVDHRSMVDFLSDVDATEPLAKPSIQIEHYNGDELRLTVNLSRACWLTFVDNWDANWRATVNGVPTPISLTLGSYKAVSIPAGPVKVVFQYRPPLIP